MLAGLGHHMTLGRLAGQQPWHRPPGIGPLSWTEKGPDPGCKDRLATQCHQRAHPVTLPCTHSLWSEAGTALDVRAWMRLLAPQGRAGTGPPARSERVCNGNDRRLPVRCYRENNLQASQVPGHICGCDAGTWKPRQPEPGAGTGGPTVHFSLGASEGRAWVDPVGSMLAVLDLHSSSKEWGPLPHSGSGSGVPSEPRQHCRPEVPWILALRCPQPNAADGSPVLCKLRAELLEVNGTVTAGDWPFMAHTSSPTCSGCGHHMSCPDPDNRCPGR